MDSTDALSRSRCRERRLNKANVDRSTGAMMSCFALLLRDLSRRCLRLSCVADKSLDSELGTTDHVTAGDMQLKHWSNLPDGCDQPFLRGTPYLSM